MSSKIAPWERQYLSQISLFEVLGTLGQTGRTQIVPYDNPIPSRGIAFGTILGLKVYQQTLATVKRFWDDVLWASGSILGGILRQRFYFVDLLRQKKKGARVKQVKTCTAFLRETDFRAVPGVETSKQMTQNKSSTSHFCSMIFGFQT